MYDDTRSTCRQHTHKTVLRGNAEKREGARVKEEKSLRWHRRYILRHICPLSHDALTCAMSMSTFFLGQNRAYTVEVSFNNWALTYVGRIQPDHIPIFASSISIGINRNPTSNVIHSYKLCCMRVFNRNGTFNMQCRLFECIRYAIYSVVLQIVIAISMET